MPMTLRPGTPRRAISAMIAPCVWPPQCSPRAHSVLSILKCVDMVSIWRLL
jgi:hypothetical protein